MCCCKVGSVSQMEAKWPDAVSNEWVFVLKDKKEFYLDFFLDSQFNAQYVGGLDLVKRSNKKQFSWQEKISQSPPIHFFGGGCPLFWSAYCPFLRPQLPRSRVGCANEWDGKLYWLKKSGWSGWGRTFQFCCLLMIMASFPKRPIFGAAGYAMNEDIKEKIKTSWRPFRCTSLNMEGPLFYISLKITWKYQKRKRQTLKQKIFSRNFATFMNSWYNKWRIKVEF